MSLDPMVWALKDAPTKDVNEFAILITMAEAAREDGSTIWLSQDTIAERCKITSRTVRTKLATMEMRGLIKLGDQSAVKHLPVNHRPVVWDLCIPYSWWGTKIDRMNASRAKENRPPMTPESNSQSPIDRGETHAPNRTRVETVSAQGQVRVETDVQNDSQGGNSCTVRVETDDSLGGKEFPTTHPLDPPTITHPLKDEPSTTTGAEPKGSHGNQDHSSSLFGDDVVAGSDVALRNDTKPSTRQRDKIWDAVAEVCGYPLDSAQLTVGDSGRIARAVKELKAVKVTSDEILFRASNYHRRFSDAALTPQALTNNWGLCATAPTRNGSSFGKPDANERGLETINLAEQYRIQESV